jgi:four helix bundle protein
MSRNYKDLRVFQSADQLVIDVYRMTQGFGADERFGLRSQLRRAAVSVATNIVEGSIRRSERHWINYLETSLGSACETRYLLELSNRLKLVDKLASDSLVERYSQLVKSLQAMITSMPAGRSTGPKAEG